MTRRADLRALADSLPDADKRLADALRTGPAVLGFVLDPDHTKSIAGVPILIRGQLSLEMLWRTAGAVGPISELQEATAGLGALSLPGDADGSSCAVCLLPVGAGDACIRVSRWKPHASISALRPT